MLGEFSGRPLHVDEVKGIASEYDDNERNGSHTHMHSLTHADESSARTVRQIDRRNSDEDLMLKLAGARTYLCISIIHFFSINLRPSYLHL